MFVLAVVPIAAAQKAQASSQSSCERIAADEYGQLFGKPPPRAESGLDALLCHGAQRRRRVRTLIGRKQVRDRIDLLPQHPVAVLGEQLHG